MPWDLRIIRLEFYPEMCIGAGFSVTTPLFQKRYADQEQYRCLSINLYLGPISLMITIPLWEDTPHADKT